MKKFLSVLLVIFFQVVPAEAVDYYLGSHKGNAVYLMTETITRKNFTPTEDLQDWTKAYDFKLKFVGAEVNYFDATIYYGFEALGQYFDQEGYPQVLTHRGEVNPRYNNDKDFQRAVIFNQAFKYLFENDYLD